jgi:hypothetical protein
MRRLWLTELSQSRGPRPDYRSLGSAYPRFGTKGSISQEVCQSKVSHQTSILLLSIVVHLSANTANRMPVLLSGKRPDKSVLIPILPIVKQQSRLRIKCNRLVRPSYLARNNDILQSGSPPSLAELPGIALRELTSAGANQHRSRNHYSVCETAPAQHLARPARLTSR